MVAHYFKSTGEPTYGVVLEGSPQFDTSQVSIGASALIVAARNGRFAVTIYNNGTDTVFIGNQGVTTVTGLPLPAGGAVSIDTAAAVYGVAASGTQSISTLETFG